MVRNIFFEWQRVGRNNDKFAFSRSPCKVLTEALLRGSSSRRSEYDIMIFGISIYIHSIHQPASFCFLPERIRVNLIYFLETQ